MKKAIGSFVSGLLLAGVAAAAYRLLKRSSAGRTEELGPEQARQEQEREEPRVSTSRQVDLNQCSVEELASLAGLDSEIIDRIIEGRPYRNKLDLVSRMIIPEAIYVEISQQVVASEPDEPIKVAA